MSTTDQLKSAVVPAAPCSRPCSGGPSSDDPRYDTIRYDPLPCFPTPNVNGLAEYAHGRTTDSNRDDRVQATPCTLQVLSRVDLRCCHAVRRTRS